MKWIPKEGISSPHKTSLNGPLNIYRDKLLTAKLFLCTFSSLTYTWLKLDNIFIIISCCSTGAFLDFAICPTYTPSVSEIGNEQCNNLQCTQTGKTSSYVHTPLVLNCWTFPPTFPCSHLPSWTTVQTHLFKWINNPTQTSASKIMHRKKRQILIIAISWSMTYSQLVFFKVSYYKLCDVRRHNVSWTIGVWRIFFLWPLLQCSRKERCKHMFMSWAK